MPGYLGRKLTTPIPICWPVSRCCLYDRYVPMIHAEPHACFSLKVPTLLLDWLKITIRYGQRWSFSRLLPVETCQFPVNWCPHRFLDFADFEGGGDVTANRPSATLHRTYAEWIKMIHQVIMVLTGSYMCICIMVYTCICLNDPLQSITVFPPQRAESVAKASLQAPRFQWHGSPGLLRWPSTAEGGYQAFSLLNWRRWYILAGPIQNAQFNYSWSFISLHKFEENFQETLSHLFSNRSCSCALWCLSQNVQSRRYSYRGPRAIPWSHCARSGADNMALYFPPAAGWVIGSR